MTTPPDLPPPMNHVFVDFENVHTFDPSVIGTKAVSFTLLLGAKQTKLDVAPLEKLMERAASVELIRLATSGKNALDFTLSYYLGRKVLSDPTAYFHIVSKDKGYGPMIKHLQSRHIHVQRHDDFLTLPFSSKSMDATGPKKVEPSGTDEDQTKVLEYLRRNVSNRPKKKKTLISHLKSILGKNATDDDASRIFEGLRQGNHLSIGEKDTVNYHLKN